MIVKYMYLIYPGVDVTRRFTRSNHNFLRFSCPISFPIKLSWNCKEMEDFEEKALGNKISLASDNKSA